MPLTGNHAELLRRGRDLFYEGRVDAAAEAFADCLHAYPDSIGAMSGLGLCYSHLGRHERALDLFRRASELRPRSAAVLFAKGLAFERAGDRTESRSSFELVLELDPAHADAERHLRRFGKPAKRSAADHEHQREAPAADDRNKDRGDLPAESAAVEAGAVEAKAPDLEPEAAAEDTSFEIDDAVGADLVEAEADGIDKSLPADGIEKPRSRAETGGRSRRPSSSQWPSVPANPLEPGDAWGGLKVAHCDTHRLVLKGARNITFQKDDPNVVEKTFFGLASKKRSAGKWKTVRIIFKAAEKKAPEKALLEFVDGDGEARLTLPGGRTADGKAVLGIRAAVHLARMFGLAIEVQGEPADGDEALAQLIESLHA